MRITLTRKIGLLLLVPLVGALVGTSFIVATVKRADTDGHFLNVAGRQRFLAAEMGAWLGMALAGQDEDGEQLRHHILDFDVALVALQSGGTIRGGRLEPVPEELQASLGALEGQWVAVKPDLEMLAGADQKQARSGEAAARLNARLPGLRSAADALVNAADARTLDLHQLIVAYLLAYGAFLSVLFLLFLLLARRYVARPVLKAAEAARRISDGDLSLRLEASGRDELATLSEAFNDMAAKLSAQIGKLRILSASVDQAGDAVVVTNAAGIIDFVNPAFEAATGYSMQDAVGHPPSILKSGKQDSAFYKDMWRTIQAGKVFRGVLVNQRKDGTLYHAEKTITPLRIDSDVITHFVATDIDVTQRVMSEQALRRANRALETLAQVHQALSDEDDVTQLLQRTCNVAVDVAQYRFAIVALTGDSSFHTVARAAAPGTPAGLLAVHCMLGNGECEPASTAISTGKIQRVEDLRQCVCAHSWRREALEHGLTSVVSVPLIASGRVIGVMSLYAGADPAFDDGEIKLLEELAGNVSVGVMSLRAKVERSHAVADLHVSQDRLQFVLSNIPVGFFTLEPRAPWAPTFISDAVRTQLGYEPAAFVGNPGMWRSLVHDADAPAAAAGMKQLLAHGHAVREYRVRDAGGHWHWIQEGTSVVRAADGRPLEIAGYWANITELVQARETLRTSEERSRALFDHASEVIFICDSDSLFLDANAACVNLLGYSLEELRCLHVLDVVPAENRPAARGRLEQLTRGEALLGERRLQNKDGTVVHVEAASRQLPDGTIATIARDLSERRRAEKDLRDMEAQLAQSQKLDAIGQLAGGVAHDFNNMLAVILSFTGFAADALKDADPIRADLEEVLKAGRRAAALTQQLLAFSHKNVVRPEVVALNPLIEDMEKLLTRTIGEHITLTTHLQPGLGNIKVDPSQMEQILVNLVVNARDAMPAGGRVELETANQEVSPSQAAQQPGLCAGGYVTLTVIDHGVGMTPEVLARIFEPFFTTKEKGKGTGLGLATVFGAVKQANGHVQVDSAPGKGTRFTIYLPTTADSPQRAQHAAFQRLRGKGQTVLVVEDEDAIRALAVRMLTRGGFHVLEAANAGEALLVCEQSEPPVDVVLTDVVMPRMSGPQLADRLRTRWPSLHVVYMSGYAGDSPAQHSTMDPAVPFVAKPFTEEDLLQAILSVCAA